MNAALLTGAAAACLLLAAAPVHADAVTDLPVVGTCIETTPNPPYYTIDPQYCLHVLACSPDEVPDPQQVCSA